MVNDLLQTLVQSDQSALLYLNNIHNTFFDYFMTCYTGKWIWVPMYLCILYVLLKNYKWQVVLCVAAAIGLTITFNDQICATLIRPIVERPRPSNPASPIANIVHLVNGRRGGGFGFPSCHACNSFGLAFFLIFLFRKKALTIFILCWATLNCYTRIYLALHYPGDILVGTIVGFLGAWLLYYLMQKTLHKITQQTSIESPDFKKARQTEIIMITGLLTITGIIIYSTIMTL